jgi:hypothetical protein
MQKNTPIHLIQKPKKKSPPKCIIHSITPFYIYTVFPLLPKKQTTQKNIKSIIIKYYTWLCSTTLDFLAWLHKNTTNAINKPTNSLV